MNYKEEYNIEKYNHHDYNIGESTDIEEYTYKESVSYEKEKNKRREEDCEYELIKKVDSCKSMSHAYDYDHGSVSIQDLEESNKYEVHWHVGADYILKYVVAIFECKILNYDPRYCHSDKDPCSDFDLMFKHLKTGNPFTIHSDLVDEGIVEFFMVNDDDL